MDKTKLKMYILVRENIPRGLGINGVGHAAVATYVKYRRKQVVKDWLVHSFRKVTCIVSEEEFKAAKKIEGAVVIKENTIGNKEIAIGFAPRHEWPEHFKNYRLIQ